ncbi:MAG: ABC transporter permease [Williamsia sp.]|nr:ABC transporter permease [Williamsia sp.]
MFKLFFSTALRNAWRNKVFTGINILGLSIGISAAVVIFLLVYHEFSYDLFQKGQDQIYRVVLDASFNGTEGHSGAVPAPLGAAIEKEVTGVAQTIPVFQFQGDATAKVSPSTNKAGMPEVYKNQAGIVFTNGSYFDLLSYQWMAGSPQTAMQAPFHVVLTESRARQYFPGLPPAAILGKQLSYNDDLTGIVSGIVKDLHQNTSFTAVEFISLPTIAKTHLQQQFMMTVWNDWMAYSQLYIRLGENTQAAQTEAQIAALYKKYNKDEEHTIHFRLQPLSDVHFDARYPTVGSRLAHKPTLYGLLAVATFLLLLGCINFINLTTANATQRAKEIGIRKTMGSSRKQLVLQFLGETLLITLVATLLSVCITPFLLHAFSDFLPDGLQFSLLSQPSTLLFLGILALAVSFLSGLYPALILSAYQPAATLKSTLVTNSGETRHAWFRKTLTVAQFVIAQFFIIATLMVSKQINYSLHADLGFNKEGIITFETPRGPRDTVALHTQQMMNAVNAIPEVALASTGFFSPADKGVAFTNIICMENPEAKPSVQIRWGDPEYLPVYGIRLRAGHNVSPSDTIREFIVNETYTRAVGFKKPEDAIGKMLRFNGKNMPVVGVMQDFHDQSTHAAISPLVFGGSKGNLFHIRLKPHGTADWQSGIRKIRTAFKQIYPEADFDLHFYDETVAGFYEREQRTASLLRWATGLSVLISCLGLLGLVIYTTNTRTKEIGIRKILGASIANIVGVLSADFIRLVFIAFLIAVPVAWWALYQWLENFAYRTAMSWWVFVLSGAFMFLMALITLSARTIKTATANPVKSLRTE